jgi:uncharacterized protein YqjF (DUF2071 family)
MGQRWHDLLFAHWRFDPAAIQTLLPPGLEVDTFDGSAWLGIVPFAMTDVRARGIPGFGRVSNFLELNVRTYVRAGDIDGVFFFSLDASSRPAVSAARRWFHLPYFRARMELQHRADWINYQSLRTHRGEESAHIALSYRPLGAAEEAAPGSLEYWLVERYRLLTGRPDGTIVRGEVHHGPWQLQPAEVALHTNTMVDWLGLAIDSPPDHVRFARFQDVYLWRPTVVVAAPD